MSFLFKGTDTFLSIPGCVAWLDASKAVATVDVVINEEPVKQVLTMGTLSDDGVTYNTQDFGNYRRPVWGEKYIKHFPRDIGNRSAMLRNFEKGRFKFLQDGSPSGVYFVSSHDIGNGSNSGISPVSTMASMTVSAVSQRGIRLMTEADFANRRRIYKQIGDGSSLIYDSRSLNVMVTGLVPHQHVSYVFLNTGVGNSLNEKLYANDVLLNEHTNITYLDESPEGYSNQITFMDMRVTADAEIRNYLSIVYDWTGYTEGQILDFDARVRELLENYKSTL